MKVPLPCITFALLLASIASAQESPFAIERTQEGVEVKYEGNLLAGYVTQSMSKPILWPVVGPTGLEMTRGYPMQPATDAERDDHPHHRSFWFTHGDVNGVDFWLEGEKGGITDHQKFTELSTDASSATVAARNIWKTPSGTPVLVEQRSYRFTVSDSMVRIDCRFLIEAAYGDLNFGDTKEGSFGIRIPGTMKVDAGKGGLITNSNGQINKAAWGKKASWVDYTGPVDGNQTGIAILCHPSSFNYPNRWHVRTYGLFAANPFGVHHFVGDKEPTSGIEIASGQTISLRYQVVLHDDRISIRDIKKEFETYSALD